MPFLQDIPLGHGPNKNMGKAFDELARNIVALESGGDLFVSPNFPRFLWKICPSFFYWYPRVEGEWGEEESVIQAFALITPLRHYDL